MNPTVDWTDPCARFRALSDAYFEIISGGKAAKVAYTANGVAREVTWAFSNIAALKREMLRAEDDCAIASGAPRAARRFAIDAGSRRQRFPWWT
jgi:hypothetical protein